MKRISQVSILAFLYFFTVSLVNAQTPKFIAKIEAITVNTVSIPVTNMSPTAKQVVHTLKAKALFYGQGEELVDQLPSWLMAGRQTTAYNFNISNLPAGQYYFYLYSSASDVGSLPPTSDSKIALHRSDLGVATIPQ